MLRCYLIKLRFELYTEATLVPVGKNHPWFPRVDFVCGGIDNVLIVESNVNVNREESRIGIIV